MKRKCPYTYPHRSRKDKVQYICSIGGYSNRFCRYPISFIVSVYMADLSFDHLWSVLAESPEFYAGVLPEKEVLKQKALQAFEYYGERLWEIAAQNAVDSFFDSDAKDFLYDGTQVAVSLALEGRGGKHLVMTEFEGMNLDKLSEEDLEVLLTSQTGVEWGELHYGYTLLKNCEWEVPTDTVNRLYKYCREAEIDFTSRKASDELEYQAVFLLYSHIETMEADGDNQSVPVLSR